MREFAHLVECDDPALIRKAVVLEKLNGMSGRFAAAAEGTSLDFARVDDGPCVEMEREIASLVVRTWADHKHFTGWGFEPINVRDAALAIDALERRRTRDATPENYGKKHELWNAVYGELAELIKAGVLEPPAGGAAEGADGVAALPDVHSSHVGDDVQVWWSGPVSERGATLECEWVDQGFGGQKGRLFARAAGDGGEWTCLTPEVAAHAPAPLEVALPAAMSGAEVELGYVVGGGGGHELHVSDARLRAGVSGVPDVHSSHAGDDVQSWWTSPGPVAAPATLACQWSDQGFGNQKGKLFARAAGGGGEWTCLTPEVAAHTPAPLEAALPAEILGGAVEPGYVVGGGGGHELHVSDARLRAGSAAAEPAAAASPIRVTPINFKPLQSLFNKLFVRRGQTTVNIAGDVLRGTLIVDRSDDPALLSKVIERLRALAGANFARKLPKGDFKALLEVVHTMEAIELPLHKKYDDVSGSIRIVPYRLKANSSQAGLDEPLLWNMNFFIDTPWWYRAGQSEVLAACELQIGDAKVIDGLRGNHVPYERARILDALPLLRAALEGLPVDDAADYDKINARLHHERTLELVCGGTVTQTLPCARDYAPTHQLRGTIINNSHFRAFAGWGAHAATLQTMVLWQQRVDPAKRYYLDCLSMSVRDQMWGNEGLMIALACSVGPHLMLLSERGFNTRERELHGEQGGVDLIRTGYNFSRFSTDTLVPAGADALMVLAVGRLHGSGHEFAYEGVRLGISEVLVPSDYTVASDGTIVVSKLAEARAMDKAHQSA